MALAAGSNPLYKSLVVGATAGTSYIKNKEVKVMDSGTVTVSFALTCSFGGSTVFGRIYKNGVAVGTERSKNTVGTTVQPDENITVAVGDLLQLYGKYSGGGGGYISDFLIKASVARDPIVAYADA